MKVLNYLKNNIGSILFIVVMYGLLFSADVRTLLIKGLMFTGLYNSEVNIDPKGTSLINTIPPPMIFKTEAGEIINTSDRNGKVYFINFWATWCPPCRAEMPSINTLSSKIKNNEKVEFIMVDVDSNLKWSMGYMKKHNFNLKVFTSESIIPGNIFGGSLPTTVIIGPDGRIMFHHTGMADYNNEEMINFINTLSR